MGSSFCNILLSPTAVTDSRKNPRLELDLLTCVSILYIFLFFEPLLKILCGRCGLEVLRLAVPQSPLKFWS